jgi:hypothetical protein
MSKLASIFKLASTFKLAPTIDLVLLDSKIGPDLYAWLENNAFIYTDGETMLAALEDAYNPCIPDWAAMVQLDTCGSDND